MPIRQLYLLAPYLVSPLPVDPLKLESLQYYGAYALGF